MKDEVGLMSRLVRRLRAARREEEDRVLAVRFACSWVRLHPWHQVYMAPLWQIRRWYLDAPAGMAMGRSFDPGRAIEEVLHIESERLAAADPGVPGYLVGSNATSEVVRMRRGGPPAWEAAALDIRWERSNCWATPDPGDPEAWVPLSPRQFTLLALVRAAAAGRVDGGRSARAAARMFAVEASVARAWFEDPARTVREMLDPRRPAEVRAAQCRMTTP
jgi:hypothetical protein